MCLLTDSSLEAFLLYQLALQLVPQLDPLLVDQLFSVCEYLAVLADHLVHVDGRYAVVPDHLLRVRGPLVLVPDQELILK